MAKIKAVIFDMDGVLIDAKDWHYEALNRALALFGHSISRYDHLVTYDGLPTRAKLEMLSKERGLPSELHGFLNELKQIYTVQIIHSQCKPYFLHEFALSKLRSEGFKLAVASNSVRDSVQLMMNKAGLTPYFETMVSNQDVKKGKPDPEIYTKTMSLLGLKPAECLVVEDNEHGIKSAEAAGAHVMVVDTVHDVSYENITRNIQKIEGARA
jgi:beta-phosphoglucomutase